MKYLIILLLFISCGNNKRFNAKNDVFFDSYKQEFIDYMYKYSNVFTNIDELRVLNMPIAFVKDINKAGICYSSGRIEINPNLQINLPNLRKVVFHELGHCVLNLGHSNDFNDLMYPKLFHPNFNNNFIYRWEMGLN